MSDFDTDGIGDSNTQLFGPYFNNITVRGYTGTAIRCTMPVAEAEECASNPGKNFNYTFTRDEDDYITAEYCSCTCKENVATGYVRQMPDCEKKCGITPDDCWENAEVHDHGGWCACGCNEEFKNACLADNTAHWWGATTGRCKCNCGSYCPHGDLVQTDWPECGCECDPEQTECLNGELLYGVHGCKCIDCTASDDDCNLIGGTPTRSGYSCKCNYDFTHLLETIPVGSLSASISDTEILAGAEEVILSYNTNNAERLPLVTSATQHTESGVQSANQGTISFLTPTQNIHTSGGEVVGISTDSPTPSPSTTFPQATQTETPCVGAGCDPHISTFFNEKFEM